MSYLYDDTYLILLDYFYCKFISFLLSVPALLIVIISSASRIDGYGYPIYEFVGDTTTTRYRWGNQIKYYHVAVNFKTGTCCKKMTGITTVRTVV